MTNPPESSDSLYVVLHDYEARELERYSCSSSTVLSIVFDGKTQYLFSSLKILLYCDTSCMDDQLTIWLNDLQLLRSPSYAPRIDPTPPQLTIAYKIFYRDHKDSNSERTLCYELAPPPQILDSKATRVILEGNYAVMPSTSSVTMAFRHSDLSHASFDRFDPPCTHTTNRPGNLKTRVVRVVPRAIELARPKIHISRLPMELLFKIFEEAESCTWQYDLLSFAQVCRQWSEVSMRVLSACLECSEQKNYCDWFPLHSLDPVAFAKALGDTPPFAHGIQHLALDQCYESTAMGNHKPDQSEVFLSNLAIIRATRNLSSLRLSLGNNPVHTNTFISELSRLRHLHTLSLHGPTFHERHRPRKRSLTADQVARCMARCPALTSFTVQNILRPNIGIARFFMRPPACTLTCLCIHDSWLSDTDLAFLTASSVRTLTRVILDGVRRVTHAGLRTFLVSIARTLVSLSIRVAQGQVFETSPLDAVVDKLWRLERLELEGEIATEQMLRRRSEMFVSQGQGGSGKGMSVAWLMFRGVPALEGCAGRVWAGWEVTRVE